MFLKNCWYVAAWAHELIDGRMLPRTLLEEPVLLFKSEGGKVVATVTGTAARHQIPETGYVRAVVRTGDQRAWIQPHWR